MLRRALPGAALSVLAAAAFLVLPAASAQAQVEPSSVPLAHPAPATAPRGGARTARRSRCTCTSSARPAARAG